MSYQVKLRAQVSYWPLGELDLPMIHLEEVSVIKVIYYNWFASNITGDLLQKTQPSALVRIDSKQGKYIDYFRQKYFASSHLHEVTSLFFCHVLLCQRTWSRAAHREMKLCYCKKDFDHFQIVARYCQVTHLCKGKIFSINKLKLVSA